jgi:DNA replication protein DnaC
LVTAIFADQDTTRDDGWRVLFMRTSDIVQRLQIARREAATSGAQC